MLLFEDTSRSVPVSSESRPSSFSSSATLSHRTRSSRPSAVSACCCSRRCSRHDWWSKARWGQCQPRGRRLLPLLPHAALLVGQLLLHPPQLLLQARAPPLLLGQLPLSRLAPAWNRAPRASASCSLRSSSCTLRPSRTSVCPASTAASPPRVAGCNEHRGPAHGHGAQQVLQPLLALLRRHCIVGLQLHPSLAARGPCRPSCCGWWKGLGDPFWVVSTGGVAAKAAPQNPPTVRSLDAHHHGCGRRTRRATPPRPRSIRAQSKHPLGFVEDCGGVLLHPAVAACGFWRVRW